MPEMRKNPLTGNWIILAPERAHRPENHYAEESGGNPYTEHQANCHFCYGNEHLTPSDVLIYGENDGNNNSKWKLRVVSNKYPAVDTEKHFCESCKNYMQVYSYAEGVSEVVIETPHHSKKMADYSLKEIELVLNSYKDRYIAISEEKNIKYIIIFKNSGKNAGASISHSHSQIIGIPVIPPLVEDEISIAKKHYEEKGACIYCNMIEVELKEKSRIIFENNEFIAFIPYAAKNPYEIWIMPKIHSNSFEKITDSQIKSLALAMKTVLYKLYKALDDSPYNYFVHTSPVGNNAENYYHWHIEIVCRTTTPAGFELGTGIFINISTPEENAKALREIPAI